MTEASPLTVAGAVLDGETVGLRCEGGEIVALGPGVEPAPGDETIEAGGAPLVAPLVNGHTHAAMTLFRGHGGDLPLMRWLRETVWPVEARLEPEDVYWGARLACLEMIRNGCARFWDMYFHTEATARAVEESGMRATLGEPLFDQLAEAGPRVNASLTPHSIYMVSEGLLGWAAELAAEREVPLHIHLSETEEEVRECLERHGARPAAYLDRLGALSERTVLAHGVWLDRAELELIAARGCTVVANPVANMKLAVGGVFPYPAARRAGVRVGLGTDGAGSNDSLDPLSDLKLFALSQRHATGDPTAIPAHEAWSIATGGVELKVGGPADFLLLRPGAPELSLGDLHADLVYSASGAVVETTVVAGRALMRESVVPGSEEVVARAVERSRRLGIG
jgi:5-methylthioadenosine/S-adenosylhomocysteine deaminase